MLASQVKTDYRLALSFLVLLNINLAFINLLPIPVLDGGHILMAIIEKIRRRPLSLKFVEYTTTGFAVLLISFMLYITIFGDFKRFGLFRAMFKTDVQIEQSAQPADSAPAPVQIIHALLRIPIFLQTPQDARNHHRRPEARRGHHRRRPSGRHAVHAHLRHDGHRRVREADARTRRRRLPACPHHRADGEGRGKSAEHCRRTSQTRTASCRLSPTSISSPKRRWKP